MVESAVLATSLVVPSYRGLRNPALIVRFEATGNYTRLHLKQLTCPLWVSRSKALPADSTAPLLVSKTLKYFADQLPGFIRVNKSSLINPRYIDKTLILDDKSMQVVLVDGTIVTVSRRQTVATADRLSLYKTSNPS